MGGTADVQVIQVRSSRFQVPDPIMLLNLLLGDLNNFQSSPLQYNKTVHYTMQEYMSPISKQGVKTRPCLLGVAYTHNASPEVNLR